MPVERFEIPVLNGTIAGERWGDGDPVIVLLHAGVADRRSWRDIAPRLPGTVVTYDLRGFGETPPSADSFTDLDDIVAVLQALAPERRALLVGNSMGGALALDTALAHPELVASLVLISPAISGAPNTDAAALDDDTARIAEALERTSSLSEIIELETWLWLDGPTSPRGRVQGEARELARAMNAAVSRNEEDEPARGSGVDAWSLLEEIECPVTIACGDLDVPFIVKRCSVAAGRIPYATLKTLAGVAHLPMLEDPDSVANLILSSINRPGH